MKLNSIQFLRAVAAILVVYEHSMSVQKMYGTSQQQNFLHLDHFGCIGVDIFFVISGFIITYISQNYSGTKDGIHFLAKRFVRINPIYYLATLLHLGVTLFILNINKKPAPSLVQILSSLSDSILIVPTSRHAETFNTILTVAWTLSFECFFYFLFFILILFNFRNKGYALIATIGSLVLTGQLLKPDDLRFIFTTNPIMLEFLLGVIICHLYLKQICIPSYIGTILIIAGIATFISMLFNGIGHLPNYWEVLDGRISLKRFICWGIPSACLVAGCIIQEKNNQLISLWNNKWMILFGNASFSIYLVHFTIFDLLRLIPTKTRVLLHPDAIIWIQLFIAIILAVGFYKAIEKPIIHYIQNNSLWNFLNLNRKKNTIKTKSHSEPINHFSN